MSGKMRVCALLHTDVSEGSITRRALWLALFTLHAVSLMMRRTIDIPFMQMRDVRRALVLPKGASAAKSRAHHRSSLSQNFAEQTETLSPSVT